MQDSDTKTEVAPAKTARARKRTAKGPEATSTSRETKPKVKKELVVMHHETMPALYRVGFKEGGVVPDVLSGAYTNVAVADKAIQNYLQTRRER